MRVVYNSFDFGLVSCDGWTIESVYDDSGQDLLFQRIHLSISGVINPGLTSTGKATATLPAGGYQVTGDVLGNAVNYLKDLVSAPRQNLQVSVGGVLVYDCPGLEAGLPCDPEGGPTPSKLELSDITGDKSADFRWSIVFAVTQCDRYLLSNRWSQSTSTDSEGMTVRTVTGTAVFRADYLYDEDLTPDSFRKWLILPTPDGMRRWSIETSVASDNTRAEYTVQDRQIGYGIGGLNSPGAVFPRPGITRIEGSITVGASLATSGPVAVAERIGAYVPPSGPGERGWIESLGGIFDPLNVRRFLREMRSSYGGILGTNKASIQGVVRVYAQPGNGLIGTSTAIDNELKQGMLVVGLATLYDRLSPISAGVGDTGTAPMTSMAVTQDIGSDNAPYIEINATFMSLGRVALRAMAYPQLAGDLMNMSSTYVLFPDASGAGLEMSPDTLAPTLPNSNNTRGDWLGAMIIQALNPGACTVPQAAGPVNTVAGPVVAADTGFGIDTVEEADGIK